MSRRSEDEQPRSSSTTLGEPGHRGYEGVDDGGEGRPRIESDGRFSPPIDDAPPDPRAVIEDLRRRLRIEQEKSLNSMDAVLGARAAAAQARAETQEIYYRLHVRETELDQLKELLSEREQQAGGTRATPPTMALISADASARAAQVKNDPAAAVRTVLSSVKRMVTD